MPKVDDAGGELSTFGSLSLSLSLSLAHSRSLSLTLTFSLTLTWSTFGAGRVRAATACDPGGVTSAPALSTLAFNNVI